MIPDPTNMAYSFNHALVFVPIVWNGVSYQMLDFLVPHHPRRLVPIERSYGNLSDPRVVLCRDEMYDCVLYFSTASCIYTNSYRAVLSVVGTLYRSCSSNVTIHHNTALHTLPLHPNSPDRNPIRRRRTRRAPTSWIHQLSYTRTQIVTRICSTDLTLGESKYCSILVS